MKNSKPGIKQYLQESEKKLTPEAESKYKNIKTIYEENIYMMNNALKNITYNLMKGQCIFDICDGKKTRTLYINKKGDIIDDKIFDIRIMDPNEADLLYLNSHNITDIGLRIKYLYDIDRLKLKTEMEMLDMLQEHGLSKYQLIDKYDSVYIYKKMTSDKEKTVKVTFKYKGHF